MSVIHHFVCPLPNGLHARPASHLAEAVGRWRSAVTFVNERTGRSANARSVLGLVGTDTRAGDPCRLEVSGDDAAAAKDALAAFVDHEFVRCDEPLAAPVAAAEVPVPRSLRAAGLAHFASGAIACRGLGVGLAVTAGGLALPQRLADEKPRDPATEQARIERATAEVVAEYQRNLETARGAEAGILRAHLAILADPAVTDALAATIRSGRSAGQALVEVAEAQRAVLGAAESAYVRERVFDLEDLVGRLCEKLYGVTVVATPTLTAPSILFADHLTPTQFLALDRRHLAGLVLEHAGHTSHAVILARSFGIPTLTGVGDAVRRGRDAGTVVVDANVGIVVFGLNDGVRRYYDREQAKLARLAAQVAAMRERPAATADGRRLEIGANLATVEEAAAAFEQGAEGVGLFRTELLFASRSTAPSEEEQYQAYVAVVQAAGGRPVIIRTLDIGGDKPVPFLPQPPEANPFLGYRGVRMYAEHAALIRTQLRALVRAAAAGPLKILVPMITCAEEARRMRTWLEEIEAELRREGQGAAAPVPLGFMLEVPSTAFLLDELCAVADFFSLGTNDLAQYFSAADRENGRVAGLNHPFHPAFLRLLKHIVSGVRARGRWIGLCGELGENPAALPLLVGLGLDEISLAAPRIAATKAALAQLDRARCEELLDQAAAAGNRAEVEAVLAAAPAREMPLLAAELVLDDVDARSKEEVIRMMVDALHVAGRTAEPLVVEEAVWRREEAYSTGFGEGFALPHCKTDALAANSIVVARLRHGVEWNALDGKPVDTVILLGIRASDHDRVHMQVLARLSRLVTRDEFRDAIRSERDTAGLLAVLAGASTPQAAMAR